MTIKHIDGKWKLYSHKGDVLGTFDSEHEAIKREHQIIYFKHLKENDDST